MSKEQIPQEPTQSMGIDNEKIEELTGKSTEKVNQWVGFLIGHNSYYGEYAETLAAVVLAHSDEYQLNSNEEVAAMFGISEKRLEGAIRQYRKILR